MRRLLATATIGAVLLLGAGCSGPGDRTDDAAAPAASSPAGAATGSGATGGPGGGTGPGGAGVPGDTGTSSPEAPAGGNAASVCDAAVKASSTAGTEFVRELGTMLQAGGKGDNAAADAAERGAQKALDRWADAMEQQADRATDARLRTVLDEIGAEVGKMKADIDSVDATRLEQLRQRLDQLCGTA
jgi:hypothetical protein